MTERSKTDISELTGQASSAGREGPLNLTWDEVRDRSYRVIPPRIEGGMELKVWCGVCDIAWHGAKLPCHQHALDAEKPVIDDHVLSVLSKPLSKPPPIVQKMLSQVRGRPAKS